MHLLPQLAGAVAMVAATMPSPLRAQCCPGAQDLTASSPDGRFVVEAKSLNGTGPSVHGPYHFRFRLLERTDGGRLEERGSFERKWDIDDHFGMELFVSPTGSGFAIEFPNEHLTFYRRDGRKVFEAAPGHPVQLSEDGHSVLVCRTVWMPGGGSGWHAEGSRVFLPLGTQVTPRLGDQVLWLLQLDAAERRESDRRIATHLGALHRADPEQREAAREGLLAHAFLSIPPLRLALAEAQDPSSAERIQELLTALRMWEDHVGQQPWRDLSLLIGLCYYPDELIRGRARWRVVSLLSPGLRQPYERDGVLQRDRLAAAIEWIQSHRDTLRWDAEAAAFVVAGS